MFIIEGFLVIAIFDDLLSTNFKFSNFSLHFFCTFIIEGFLIMAIFDDLLPTNFKFSSFSLLKCSEKF